MHTCPKCGKEWECVTQFLFDEILGRGGCDMPDSECYECSPIPEMKEIYNIVVEETRKKKKCVK